MGEKKGLTFEKNLEKIDEIINKLENGEIELEDSIEKYEEAMKLLKNCKEIIEGVEGKLKKVSVDNKGDIKITQE